LRLLKSVLFIFRQEKSTPVFYRSIFVTVGVYVEALLNPLCVRLIWYPISLPLYLSGLFPCYINHHV